MAENKNPDSNVSQPELVGRWFTQDPKDLWEYLLMRPTGGKIIAVKIPNSQLDSLHVSKNEIVNQKNMDIEPENWIISDEYLKDKISIEVPDLGRKRFKLQDREMIMSLLGDLKIKIEQ